MHWSLKLCLCVLYRIFKEGWAQFWLWWEIMYRIWLMEFCQKFYIMVENRNCWAKVCVQHYLFCHTHYICYVQTIIETVKQKYTFRKSQMIFRFLLRVYSFLFPCRFCNFRFFVIHFFLSNKHYTVTHVHPITRIWFLVHDMGTLL